MGAVDSSTWATARRLHGVRLRLWARDLRRFTPRFLPTIGVTLTQLRFASLAVVSSREDLHPQDRADAGRT